MKSWLTADQIDVSWPSERWLSLQSGSSWLFDSHNLTIWPNLKTIWPKASHVTGDHFQFKISQPPMHRPCTMSRARFVAREFLIECANQVAPDGGRLLPCQCWTTHTSSQMYHRFDLFGPLTSSIFYNVDINIIRYYVLNISTKFH